MQNLRLILTIGLRINSKKIAFDAGLACLAGKDFHSISYTLFCEMKTYLQLYTNVNWNEI